MAHLPATQVSTLTRAMLERGTAVVVVVDEILRAQILEKLTRLNFQSLTIDPLHLVANPLIGSDVRVVIVDLDFLNSSEARHRLSRLKDVLSFDSSRMSLIAVLNDSWSESN